MNILNLLSEHGLEPKQVACTHGGEYASACPACGGHDRFRSWPEQDGKGGTWYCRGCDKGGDCIQFLRDFDGMSYRDACRHLGVEANTSRITMPKHPTDAISYAEPAVRDGYRLPQESWMDHAEKLVIEARMALQEHPGTLKYLASRGISAEIAWRFCLGFVHGESGHDYRCRGREAWGLPAMQKGNGKPKLLWIPEGLLIPAFDAAGRCIRLRIRRTKASIERFSPDMKYVVIPGSSSLPMLVRPKARACVVVESELDAIACAASCSVSGVDAGALSVLTALGKPDPETHELLRQKLRIEVALDFDKPDEHGNRPGAKGVAWWLGMYPRAIRWPVPAGKDPGEAVALGINLAVWIRDGLPPVFRLESQKKEVPDESGQNLTEKPSENRAAVCVQEQLTADESASRQRVLSILSAFQLAGIHVASIRPVTKKEYQRLLGGV